MNQQDKPFSAHGRTERMEFSEDKLYRTLYRNAFVGLYRNRVSDGRVLACNLQMAHFFGYPSIEAMIENHSVEDSYVDPTDRTILIKRLKEEGEILDYEARFRRLDGSIMWGRYSAKLYPEEG